MGTNNCWALAAKVTGRFRGKYKYVEAWVSWDREDRDKYPIPRFIKVPVTKEFQTRHRLFEWMKHWTED